MEVRGRREKKRGLAAAAAAACEERRAVGPANPLLLHHPCSVTGLARPKFYRVGSPDRNAAPDELLSILLFEGEEQEQDDDDNNNNNNEIESAGVFSGSSSPPSRPANPMVRDPMFGEVNPSEPFLLWAGGSTTGCTSSPSGRKASPSGRKACGSEKSEIRPRPPASRIEGFDLFDRERGRRRGITAIA
ncbi:uncharacterized protein LOC109722494 isoform X2 [Ananas comosus]|uniref:Uncharacterized protein LOC109722494 isoform X2 n=1 Tax=Ananas comosus TaxID=4615 RepID=A0A6P5GLH6_ANACO|nr:uncharacterized protein LOC109722494 isoform X2 [Ananas comosus]